MTFDELATANILRCEQAFGHPVHTWSENDWATAMGGEIGEAVEIFGKLLTFLNTSKKLHRHRDGYEQAVASQAEWVMWKEEWGNLTNQLAEEIADIVIYADLFTHRLGRVLEKEVIKKFNKVSEKRRSDIKL